MTVESYKWTENDLHVGDSIYLAEEGAGDYLCTIRINSRNTVHGQNGQKDRKLSVQSKYQYLDLSWPRSVGALS